MKTPTPFKTLLLLVLLVAAGGFSQQAMAQEKDTCVVAHIHTYMNGQLVPWDSLRVYVKDDNHYHYHIFWMYYPDTIMANCPLDTHEYSSDVVFSLSSAYPNPCLGESNVRLTNQEAGNVNLSIVDMQGHLCCQKNMNLTAGEHLLSVTLPHNGLYFLKAESRQGNEVCKVLCAEGKGGEFDIGLASSSFLSKEKNRKVVKVYSV